MNDVLSAFLIGFLIGLIFGAVVYSYIKDGSNTQAANPADLQEMLKSQIVYQQSQNMMRQLQLDQMRQEAELRKLTQESLKYSGLLEQPDYRHVVAAVEAGMQKGGYCVN